MNRSHVSATNAAGENDIPGTEIGHENGLPHRLLPPGGVINANKDNGQLPTACARQEAGDVVSHPVPRGHLRPASWNLEDVEGLAKKPMATTHQLEPDRHIIGEKPCIPRPWPDDQKQ